MIRIARIMKSNGTDGGILIGFRNASLEDISTEEPVYIYFDGLPVPFFFTDIHTKGSGKAIAHLNDIESLADAEELTGRDIFVDYLEDDDDSMEDLSFLEGWAVAGVGRITEVIEIPANPCIEVSTDNGPVLIPLHEDLIKEMDRDRKVIVMDIPKGILDL